MDVGKDLEHLHRGWTAVAGRKQARRKNRAGPLGPATIAGSGETRPAGKRGRSGRSGLAGYLTLNTASIGLWSEAIVPFESRVSIIWADFNVSFDAPLEVKR
jgi:hypothetical protein